MHGEARPKTSTSGDGDEIERRGEGRGGDEISVFSLVIKFRGQEITVKPHLVKTQERTQLQK